MIGCIGEVYPLVILILYIKEFSVRLTVVQYVMLCGSRPSELYQLKIRIVVFKPVYSSCSIRYIEYQP